MTELLESTAIIAVDPGGTTGCATYWDGQISAVQVPDPMEFMQRFEQWIDAALKSGYTVHAVCERFVIGPATLRHSQQTTALELIGAVKYAAHRRGVPVTLQAASEAKTFCDNARLRNLRLYVRGKDHANDALRHLVLWLVKNGWRSPRLILS